LEKAKLVARSDNLTPKQQPGICRWCTRRAGTQSLEDVVPGADELARRRQEVEDAAQAAVVAKTNFDNQVKTLNKVAKYVAEIKELEDKYGKLFDEIDRTRDGNISHNELKRFISQKDYTLRLQLGIGRWQEFLDEVDLDGDRMVSRTEFVDYFTMKNLNPVTCWGAIFDAIDTNRDGELTKKELRNYSWNENPYILKLLGFSTWTELMDVLDKDLSGTIDRDEWISHFATKEIKGTYRPAKRQKR